MNDFQMIIIAYSLFASVPIMIFGTIYWLMKNNIDITINEFKEGVFLNQNIRCRVSKNKLYALKDFLGTKPLNIDYEEFKDNFMMVEGIPFIGTKRTLKLCKQNNEYFSWEPPIKINAKGKIHNHCIVKINMLRTELYESTSNTNKADMIYKFATPIALVILALAMLIFFPKIYDKIIEHGAAHFESSFGSWTEQITEKIKPLG